MKYEQILISSEWKIVLLYLYAVAKEQKAENQTSFTIFFLLFFSCQNEWNCQLSIENRNEIEYGKKCARTNEMKKWKKNGRKNHKSKEKKT